MTGKSSEQLIAKNKNPRLLPIRGELAAIVERARDARKLDCPSVFHSAGEPIGDFRKAWHNACVAAGSGRFEQIGEGKHAQRSYHGLLIHDLRRSAVRNMVQSGIREKVAMALSGHKTRAIFDRYHIVSEDDLAQASERLFGHLEQQAEAAKVLPLKKVS